MEHPNLRPATSPACWIGGTWVSRPPQTHPPWEHQQIWGGTVEHLVGSSGPSSPVTGHQSGPEWLAAFHRGAPCWRLEPGSDGGGWCWKLEVANLGDFGVHFGKCLGSAAFFWDLSLCLFYLLQADHHDKSFPADSLKWFHRSTALVACNPCHWANIQHSSFQPKHARQPASHEATRLFVATHIKWIHGFHGLHCALWSLGSLDSAATSQLLHSDFNLCGYPEKVCVCVWHELDHSSLLVLHTVNKCSPRTP